MIPKRFEDIEFSDIEALLNNKVPEGKTLEYKREISSNEKLFAGVSALANASGGDFIIGIEADKGIPTKLAGLKVTDADSEKARLNQIIQSGIEPRLPSLNIEILQSPAGDDFILIRTKQSWMAPHRVKANDKFYGRNSVGKYPMDVSELRTAFMLTEQLSERIKNFRLERVKKLETQDELPVDLATGGKLILHLIPLSALTTSFEIDLQEFYESSRAFLPLGTGAFNRFINLDGIVVFSRNSENKCDAYAQLFRNGCIESVNVFETRSDGKNFLPSIHCETILMNSVTEYRKMLSSVGVELPLTVFVSLLDVKDYEFAVGERFARAEKRRLDRNNLIFPEQIILRQEDNSVTVLRPIFDKLWNSFGFLRSFNFDEKEEWKSR